MKRATILVLMAVLAVAACSRPAEQAIPERRAGDVASDVPATPSKAFSASCVYTEGFVERGRGDSWSVLEIGDSVEASDTVRTGPDGVCDIVFGATATLRLQPGTVLALESLALSDESARVEASLSVGSVLNKVQKLAGTDSYMIRTDTSVCGVRGTDFMVSVDPVKGTTVAVKSGRVAVVPASQVVYDLLESSSTNEVAAVAIQSIVASASIVSADQEITIDKAMAESVSAIFTEIAAEVAAAPQVASAGAARIAPPPLIMFDEAAVYAPAAIASSGAAPSATAAAPATGSAPAAASPAAPAAAAAAAPEARPDLAAALTRVRRAAEKIKPRAVEPVKASVDTRDRLRSLDKFELPVIQVPTAAQEPVTLVPTDSSAGAATVTDPPPAVRTPTPARPAPAKPAPSVTVPAPAAPQADKIRRVLGSWAALRGSVSGSVVRVPATGTFVMSDADGNLSGVSPSGEILWSVATANRGADRSYPVPFKGIVYYSGSNELVAVDAATGKILAREVLEGDRAHIFGTRVVPFPNAVVFPTRDTLEVLDERTGKVVRSVPVPGGTTMTPANYDGLAAIVNQKGVFMLIDLATGEVRAQVQTGAVQPVAIAPRILGQRACFADRKGLLVMVDLSSMTVVWERALPGSAGVFSDIEMGEEGVFAFSKDVIFGYSLRGEKLMDPIPKVSAAPLLSRGVLYYGTMDGFLVALRLEGMKELGRVELGSKASARPLFADGFVYVGTVSGRLVKVDVSKF